MNSDDLKKRTKEYAMRIIKLVRSLPSSREGRIIGDQLFRSGTSVASNYRAALRARSKAEFISKLGTVEEETDESIFWMELLIECEMVRKELLWDLIKEGNELLSIIIATKITARKSIRKKSNQK